MEPTLWSCPSPECPPTDKPPRDVEELGEVADRESQEVLSIQEVAKLLKVPVSAIYAWNRRGVGPPFYKVGSKLRYRKSNARKWLANTSSHARFAVASAARLILETPLRWCRVSDRPLRSTYAGAAVLSGSELPTYRNGAGRCAGVRRGGWC